MITAVSDFYIPALHCSVVNQEERPKNEIYFLFNSVDIMKVHFMSTVLQEIKQKINEISRLTYNWDGYGAIAIPDKVINNSFKFIDTLNASNIQFETTSLSLVPTPYGTIVLDLTREDNLVSIEIGLDSVGFFAEIYGHEDIVSEGEKTDFRHIPSTMQKAIDLLYV